MRDESSLRRQWLLLKTLSSRRYGLTVRELAAEAGVAEKTIRRDLDAFRSVGFPLEETVGEFGRKSWRIATDWNQPPLYFTFEEALALYLGRRLLEPLAGTLIWGAAQRAFQKIRSTLNSSTLNYLERFARFFHHTAFGAHDYSRRAELIEALEIAIEDSKAVHLLYQSERATEPAYRDVYPYGLTFHRGALHLVARDPEDDKVKHYKIDRIEAVEISPFPFQRPPDFDLAAHLADSFGVYHRDGALVTVKVRFAPAVARYIQESEWHKGQRLTKQRDGSVLAEFRLSCTEEIKSWILSFGAKALVLEPESLRREIAEELQALLASYSPPQASPIPGTNPPAASQSPLPNCRSRPLR